MGGDFTGCTSLRKKSCSGGSANSKTSSNGGGGGGGGGGNNSNSSSSSRNHEGAGKGRRIFDNNNGGIGESGVLVPVHHHYKDPLKTYKIVILGDGGVGKSGNLYIYIFMCTYVCFGTDIAIPINTIPVLLSSSINSLIAKLMTLSAEYVQHIGCIRR